VRVLEQTGYGMVNGTIKWFNTKNGLGLIIDENGNKVRLHFSAFKDDSYKTISAGDAVEFTTKEGKRGPACVTCSKL